MTPPLGPYRQKRRFSETPEPPGSDALRSEGRAFVVQKHQARRLHYDLRLEIDGVLKSWAVPKGPSLDPKEKRLALEVEDHPVEYGDFEGVIPDGQYGSGTVLLWDRGLWSGPEDPAKELAHGKLTFQLAGEKLEGGWTLVRMPTSQQGERTWLLIKQHDEYARSAGQYDVLAAQPQSVMSGKMLEEIAAAPTRVWGGGKGPARSVFRQLGRTPGAKKCEVLPAVSPQLASPATTPPRGDKWLHEIKFDGYRLISRLDDSGAQLLSRRGQQWTGRFPEIAQSLGRLPVRSALLDGELVALQPNGASSFARLQSRLRSGQTDQLVYFIFDLLAADGYDLRSVPLERRKRLLAKVLDAASDQRLQYVDHFQGDGLAFFQQCCQTGLEGIISKRRDRPHRSDRSPEWVKVKCCHSEEFVVVGFTPPKGSRRGLGALAVAYYDATQQLVYAGRVGTGFSEQMLDSLYAQLEPMRQKSTPIDIFPCKRPREVLWLRPTMVVQVEYRGWTEDGLLWHPAFIGIREDREVTSVVRERPRVVMEHSIPRDHRVPAVNAADDNTIAKPVKRGREAKSPSSPTADIGMAAEEHEPLSDELRRQLAAVRLTRPQRILFPESQITKLDLVRYYVQIAAWILPHVENRPLTLVRCPEGREGDCFYQKHVAAGTPDTIQRVLLEGHEKENLVVRDLAGLVSTVQINALELHPWGARADRPDRPDRMIFDLDPGPSVRWRAVIEAAEAIRQRLAALRLAGWVKTSGGKGLHVVVPLQRRHSWPEVKKFAHALGRQLVREAPRQLTISPKKSDRQGKIFIDYLRNQREATAVAPYSTRALPHAPVSTPLSWQELGDVERSDQFRLENLVSRLASLSHDPWDEFFEIRQSVTAAARKQLNV